MITDLRVGDPDTVGPYRLTGRLGGGGMGQVYLARSPGGRTVAVKVIRPELAGDSGFRARFAQEVSAARNVSGVFTAAVIDADPQARLPWMATAYVPGPSLEEAVVTQGPLPAASVRVLAAGLAEGLQAIHAAGLVHRDLKPSNVLLAADGPRVIDFGISAAREASRLTQSGYVMGSPGFLSPEQAMGETGDESSDVFGLGAVLAFAAAGIGPFGDGPAPAIVHRVVYDQPDLSRVPESLLPLIGPCLSKTPGNRPATRDLLAWLSVWLGDGASAFPPDWLPEQVSATILRYPPTTAGRNPAPPADAAQPRMDAASPADAAQPTMDAAADAAPPADAAQPTMDAAMQGRPITPPRAGAPVPEAPSAGRPAAKAAAADAWADPAGDETGQIVLTRSARNMRRLLITCGLCLLVAMALGVGYLMAASGKSPRGSANTAANQPASHATKSRGPTPRPGTSAGPRGTSANPGNAPGGPSSATNNGTSSASKQAPTTKASKRAPTAKASGRPSSGTPTTPAPTTPAPTTPAPTTPAPTTPAPTTHAPTTPPVIPTTPPVIPTTPPVIPTTPPAPTG